MFVLIIEGLFERILVMSIMHAININVGDVVMSLASNHDSLRVFYRLGCHSHKAQFLHPTEGALNFGRSLYLSNLFKVFVLLVVCWHRRTFDLFRHSTVA